MSAHKLMVTIQTDDWFPVYTVAPYACDEPDHDAHIEIDAVTLDRWQRTVDEFAALQNEIREKAFTRCVAGHQIPIGTDCRCGK